MTTWRGCVTGDHQNGSNTVVFSASYDDKGRMMRSTDQGGCVSFYRYDEAGRPIEKITNGKTAWIRRYDASGNYLKD